ncbi:MAG: hypothetical protein Q4E69_02180 [Bacilli bacterium]|nr:hypothetical protein [Bacilli bacterium]
MYTLKNINCIYLGKSNNTNYLILEDYNNTIILNLNKGIEEHNLDISVDHIEYIYNEGNEFQEKVDLDDIKNVSLITNVELINIYTNKNVSSPFLVCIKDKSNNRLFIDAMLNTTYTRKGHYKLKTFSNTKVREIYRKNKKTSIRFTKLLIKMCKKLRVVVEIDEVDTV